MTEETKNIDSRQTNVPSKAHLVFDLFNEQKLHPIYDNSVQNNLTQSIYQINHYNNNNQKKYNLYRIFDIPEYLSVTPKFLPKNFGTKSIVQYKGFMVDLNNYASLEEYIDRQLSKRSKKRLRKVMTALAKNHTISYHIYHGEIDRHLYSRLMDKLAHFLKKRFDQKKIHNKYLEKWNYYCELTCEKINQGLASLFVISDSEKPICITLNYHFEDMIFSEIEGFDIDYSNYNLGDISMSKHLQWCFENNIKLVDLSMGETPFKNKWCNRNYRFQYHLHYNKQNLVSLLIMVIHWSKLNLKQLLRDIGLLGSIFRYDRLLFILKSYTAKSH